MQEVVWNNTDKKNSKPKPNYIPDHNPDPIPNHNLNPIPTLNTSTVLYNNQQTSSWSITLQMYYYAISYYAIRDL